MAADHSFTSYVAKRFDNIFWAVAEQYLNDNADSLCSDLHRIHRAGEMEISDVKVEHVWVNDLPGMKIQFDVALSIWFEISEGDYHYDNSEEKKVWIMVRCCGDLDCNLDDFEIMENTAYNGKNRANDPMDDALVPVILPDNLDAIAEHFLRDHYKKALLQPTWVDPLELAKSMNLSVKFVYITKDESIFGRSYFFEMCIRDRVEVSGLLQLCQFRPGGQLGDNLNSEIQQPLLNHPGFHLLRRRAGSIVIRKGEPFAVFFVNSIFPFRIAGILQKFFGFFQVIFQGIGSLFVDIITEEIRKPGDVGRKYAVVFPFCNQFGLINCHGHGLSDIFVCQQFIFMVHHDIEVAQSGISLEFGIGLAHKLRNTGHGDGSRSAVNFSF